MKKNIWAMTLIVLAAGTTLVFAQGMKDGANGKDMMGKMMGEDS